MVFLRKVSILYKRKEPGKKLQGFKNFLERYGFFEGFAEKRVMNGVKCGTFTSGGGRNIICLKDSQ